MKPKLKVMTVVTFAFLFLFESVDAQQAKRNPHEQSEFGTDDEKLDRPAPLPDEVLQIIRQTNSAPADELPAEWLLASEIHLGAAGELDLIVVGTGGLRGAHSVPFWIFRKKSESYELVLTTGGDSLRILKTIWNGHRSISAYNVGQAGRELTTTTYRFDGRRYKEFKKRTEVINQ